jgi:phospholipase/carboxylesterase
MNGFSLKHAVREPAASPRDRAPLLLLLHGLRSNEQDLMGLAPLLDKRFFIVSARAPLQMGHGAYAWYNVEFLPDGYIINGEEAERSRATILRFVAEVVDSYNVDPQRVFLSGFSQGGAMTLTASLSDPKRFAGVAAMSGRLLPEAHPPVAPPDDLRGLPVLAVHGVYDSVIPISYGREIRDELGKLPVDLTYREFNMAHEVNQESISLVSSWLSARLDAASDWRAAGAP